MVLGACLQFVVADKYYIGGFEDGQTKGRRYFRNDLLSGFNTDYPPDAPTAKSPTDRLGDKLNSHDTTTNTILQDTEYGKVSAIILQMFIIGITIADSALTGGFSIASPCLQKYSLIIMTYPCYVDMKSPYIGMKQPYKYRKKSENVDVKHF